MSENNKKGKMRRRARRDVRAAYKPQVDAINRDISDARRDELDTAERIQQIYAQLQNSLAPLAGNYDQIAQGIGQDYTTGVNALTAALPGGAPNIGGDVGAAMAAANQAVSGAAGTLAAGGQTMLASDRSRNLGYQTSVARQAPLEAKDMANKSAQFYRDIIQDLKTRRLDVQGDKQAAFMARLDALKQQKWERGMAQKEYELRERAYDDNRSDRRDDERDEDRRDRNNRDFTADEALTDQIKGLKKRRRNVNEQIAEYEAMGNDPYAQDQLTALRRRKQTITKKVKRKKRRRSRDDSWRKN